MLIPNKLRWMAKTVSAIIGAIATFVAVLVSVVDDGNIDMGEVTVLLTAVVTLNGTCIAVFKTQNVDVNDTTNV